MALLSAEIIEPKLKQTATFIFLHGLGDNGSGWLECFRNVVPPYCKIICPNARPIPVTLNLGTVMPAWYDLYALGANAKQDEPGIIDAAKELDKFVEAERSKGIPADRIVVGGFSQGGSTALYYTATKETRLGGLVALSCWLPLHEKLTGNQDLVTGNREIPVLQCHGKIDPIVPFEFGKITRDVMKKMGFSKYSFRPYCVMGHSSCDEEMSEIKKFLETCLPPLDANNTNAGASTSE